MNNITRTGDTPSIQLSKYGIISDLDSEDFELVIGVSQGKDVKERFLIKNQELDNVTLEVIPAGSISDDYVSVIFEPGWNPEWARKIKINAEAGNLLWGY